MAGDKNSADLTALEEHLEIHGSRIERWPDAARRRFDLLLKENARARELLAETRALDDLLDRAPLPDARRMADLTERIAALAKAEGREQRTAAPVIDLTARRQARRPPVTPMRWKVASALAASLLAGIYLGSSPPVSTAVESVASLVGVAPDTESSDLVLIYDPAADEEEFL